MSTYTTQLRYICEQYAGLTESATYTQTPSVIAAARPKLFDFSYPIYDSSYKSSLETKIINHFYLREIGAETASQFKFMLSRTMNEIMPYYNKLYKSADMEYNPFYDADYYREHKGEDTKKSQKANSEEQTETGNTTQSNTYSGDTDSTTTKTLNLQDLTTHNTSDTKTLNTSDTKTLNTSDTKTLNTKDTTRKSDTPQGGLTGIEGNDYLSEAIITDKTGTETIARTGTETLARTGTETDAKTGTETTARTGTDTTVLDETQSGASSTTGTSSSTSQKEASGTENINGTDTYLDHIYGKMGSISYSKLLQEYRDALINIDMMIINELEVCFMNIY